MENERWKDPKSWDCLDDAQRETIKNWYEEVLENNKKNHRKNDLLLNIQHFLE